jgi:hypothetical protein
LRSASPTLIDGVKAQTGAPKVALVALSRGVHGDSDLAATWETQI